MAIELIAPKTAAETVGKIEVRKHSVPMTIIASGLTGSETIDVNIETAADTYVAVNQNGDQTQLTETNNVITIYGPGKYQVVKGVTSGSVGVYITSDINYG